MTCCCWKQSLIKTIFHPLIPMLYFIWPNPNKIFTVVNAVAINVMVQCSETELDHYINANGITFYFTQKAQ